tara:strand:+ start:1899 stop:3275 length:1377 start_codon:yes stop_codon:yes gene_type:complete
MTKISDLSDGGTLQSTDELIVVRSGGNARAKMNTLPDMTVSQSPSVPSSSAQIFYNSTKGAVLRGQGSTSDVTIENDAGQTALKVPTGTQRVDITTLNVTGSAGIGTQTPDTLLELVGADPILTIRDTETSSANGNATLRLAESGASDSLNNYFDLKAVGGKFEIIDNWNEGGGTGTRLTIDDIGQLSLLGSTTAFDTTGSELGLQLYYETDTGIGTLGTYSSGGTTSLTFHTNSGGAASSEAMRIDGSGNVGISTTAPAYELDVDSTIHIGNDGGSSFSHSRLIFDANGAGRAAGNFFHNQADDVEYFAGSPYNKSDSFAICRNATASHADATSNITNALVVVDSAGNLHVGGSTTPTSSAGNLVLNNGTAPAGSATNGVVLYAEDVSSSSELKVRDEAGNVTTLSPHNFDLIPEGPSEDMAWSYFSERDGKRINVDMLKALRVLERISGEQLVFEN